MTTVEQEEVRVYVCLELARLTDHKYMYYQRHLGKHVVSVYLNYLHFHYSRFTSSIQFGNVESPNICDPS